MWEDSYLKLYKLWLETTGEQFENMVELSTDASPEKYKEFYDVWVKTCHNSSSKFTQIPTLESSKETFEKLMISAEESNKIYRSWIAEMEENSRVTREVLQVEPNSEKYTEVYDMWMKSYGKIFNELLTLPFRQNIKEIFENFTGTPDIYSESVEQISKLWNDSYTKLYSPWIESMMKLSAKSAELSRGDARPEAYKEFYNLWAKTYEKAFDNFFENTPTTSPFKEILEPIKNAGKIYTETFTSISSAWMKSYPSPTNAV